MFSFQIWQIFYFLQPSTASSASVVTHTVGANKLPWEEKGPSATFTVRGERREGTLGEGKEKVFQSKN